MSNTDKLIPCEWCGTVFEKVGRAKYCKKSCKQRAYEARRYGAYNAIAEALRAFPRDCPECGEPLDPSVTSGPMAITADHIIPVSKGGVHDLSNLAIIHRGCNSTKGTRIQAE